MQTIARWHREGYSELPEYAHLKTLMEAPVIDAGETLRARFPLPRYVVCDHGSSQVRVLCCALCCAGLRYYTL